MDKKEQALEMFRGEYSCSQSVFAVMGTIYGIDRDTALKIAASFSGGMGHTDSVCGAVTGAIMVIGMKYGGPDAEGRQDRSKAYEKVNEFTKKFLVKHGTLQCTELLGENLSQEGGVERANEKDLFRKNCDRLIEDTIDILEDL